MEKNNEKDEMVPTKSAEEIKIGDKNLQGRELKKILIVIGLVLFLLLIWVIILNSIRYFEYRGVDYSVVKEGKLIFYQTAFPMYSITGKHIADYNVYIRNDPRELREIPFNGELNLLSNMVINSTEDFNCEGKGIIAVANFANSLTALGTKVITDENASCDREGRYMFVQIQEGNETKIEKFGPSCYYLDVNNCEILEVTEKFMVEVFTKLNS